MKRRSFFGLLAGWATALGIVPRWTTAAASEVEHSGISVPPMSDPRATISMDQYTSDAFASRVGQVFSFHRTADANDPPIHLELVDVQTSRHQGQPGARRPFSVLFALRSDDATQESTLHLRHDDFDRCAWFVNRVAAPERDRQTAYYEAVFG
jgi:hypothetical protein